jgi:hypothetical protein
MRGFVRRYILAEADTGVNANSLSSPILVFQFIAETGGSRGTLFQAPSFCSPPALPVPVILYDSRLRMTIQVLRPLEGSDHA